MQGGGCDSLLQLLLSLTGIGTGRSDADAMGVVRRVLLLLSHDDGDLIAFCSSSLHLWTSLPPRRAPIQTSTALSATSTALHLADLFNPVVVFAALLDTIGAAQEQTVSRNSVNDDDDDAADDDNGDGGGDDDDDGGDGGIGKDTVHTAACARSQQQKRTRGPDAALLVDWLASPETEFAAYLLRFLVWLCNAAQAQPHVITSLPPHNIRSVHAVLMALLLALTRAVDTGCDVVPFSPKPLIRRLRITLCLLASLESHPPYV